MVIGDPVWDRPGIEKPLRIREAFYIVQKVSDRTDADGLLTP